MQLDSRKIYCFTPLVSLGTFVIESILAFYILYKYRKTEFGIVSFFVLLSLASFQLPEYLLCTTDKYVYYPLLMQISFIGTIFLPALGMHLVHLLNEKKYTKLVKLGYILASLVSVAIILSKGEDFMHICTGHYVRFSLGTLVTKLYFFTYLTLVGSSIYILISKIIKRENRNLNIWMLMAFLVFLIPTYTLYFLSFIPNNGIPSVLCGFALFAALILIAKILPLYHKDNY